MTSTSTRNTYIACLGLLAGLTTVALAGTVHETSENKAKLIVRLPERARLVVGSDRTMQRGAERIFLSPILEPGRDFTYTLRASWETKDGERTVIRKVRVRAGEESVVDFNVTHADETRVKTRTFEFTYSATIGGIAPDKPARIWLPIPQSSMDQDVEMIRRDLPGKSRIETEPKLGNKMLYVEAVAGSEGKIPVSITYRVTRCEVVGDLQSEDATSNELAFFLQPDARVPVAGKPIELIKDKQMPMDQMETARVLYDVVNGHMKYSKHGTGWGNGDSVWACESRYGNCSDFHSLFISLARSLKIPAKFEMGFPLPAKRGEGDIPGYHCWAKFYPQGHSWVPVDISEANKNPLLRDYFFGNLSEDRVAFTTGRDLDLVPRQAGPPLNFFIYPYVEVDGKPVAQDKTQRKFSFRDVGSTKQR